MKLLVTRPINDAQSLSKKLEELGVIPEIFPLIKINCLDFTIDRDLNYQAVLVTSSNSLRCLQLDDCREDMVSLPVYAVGDASSRAAQNIGFEIIYTADGDLEALVSLIREKMDPSKGPLLYLSGEVISGDLKNLLEAEGYQVDRVILYSADQTEKFSDSLISKLRNGHMNGCLLYSKRTAQIFCDLIARHNLAISHQFTLFCLSQAVADKINSFVDATDLECNFEIKVAQHPTQNDMLDLISKNITQSPKCS